jgi:2-octaprenyl-6-methoxyphenol hydroxylase
VNRFDIAVIGGGMVGASFALALAESGRSVVLVESVAPDSQAQPSFDERTTALGNASRRIFQSLGIWNRIAPYSAAIRVIHVSDAGRFGFARLDAAEQGIDAFGYVAPNRVIGTALWRGLESARPRIELRAPARPEDLEINADGIEFTLATPNGAERVHARLVVAADGAESKVRAAAGIAASVEDYGQVALVSNVSADRPQQGIAFERFTEAGPLAVLPLHDGSYTMVWALSPEAAERALALDEREFMRELQHHFGWRAGRFLRVGRRVAYPLKLSRAMSATAPRTVLIGNASQALHPVAGQGFNLGLRDAAALAELLASDAADPGSADLLARFAAWRAADRRGVVRFTDGLVKLFGDRRPHVRAARDLGLLLFDIVPPVKSALARVSAGFGGRTPRLARGLRLS